MKLDRRQLLLASLAPALGCRKHPTGPLIDRGFARVTEIAPGV